MITFNDASDLDSAITAAQKIITRQALEPVNIIAETANPDIPPDVLENANNALIRNKISNAVFWDVNQTIRQAQELTRQFPGFALTVYNSHTDMPADLRQRVEAAGMTPSRVQAFIMPDSNDVILIANKVPPSQVAKVIGHEIIGHRGIRAVFGEDYDNLLDLVYRDHAVEIDQLAGAYARNPKNNVENQRYLTEEYLANCANAKVKPSWWKELIAKIRAWLRKRYPSLQFTQKDIEGVLSMASRYLQKNKVGVSGMENTTDGNTGDAGNTDLRFMSVNETGFNGNERDLTGDDKAFPERTENEYTAVRNVLRSIQGNILNNEDTGIKAKLSSTGVNKMLSNKARDKSKNNGFEDAEHLQAAANIDRLFANAVLTEDRPDKNNDPNIVSIKRFSAPFYTGRGFAEARLTVKESIEHGNRIYSLELDEIKKPSSPDKGGLDKQANTPALDGYSKLIQKIENASAKIKNNSKNDNLPVSLADPDNLVLVASSAETVSQAREYAASIDLAAAGKTDVDIYGNKLSEIFEDWDSADPMTREAWMRDYYEDEMREAESRDRLESDFAQKDAYRDAFDTIEEKISAALDEYDLTIDRAKTNAAGDSFYISFDDNEGESYTLRFSNHQQPVRGSYHTSNARETSGIGGSRSVADVSVVLDNGAFDLTPAMEFIRKVAGVSDLSDGSDGGDLRFLLSEYSEDQTADIVAVLRPYVGYYLAKDDADYQAHLKSLGIDVDVRDAHAFAVLAMRENLADQAARSAEKRKKTIEERNKKRSEYLYNSIPLYREAIDFAGTEDFKIKPSARFRCEEFSGSWISPEFVKFSKAKKKDPSKLDAAAGEGFAEGYKQGREASRKGFSEKRKADRYKKSLLYKRLLTLALHIGAIAEMLHIVE